MAQSILIVDDERAIRKTLSEILSFEGFTIDEAADGVEAIKKIKERYAHIHLDDRGTTLNQTYAFANQFAYMLELALVMTKGALLRNEFRGSHYKPEFPSRDDANWLKTTIATYDPQGDEPLISYLPVDTRYLKPLLRDYSKAKKITPEFENLPTNIPLPL